MIRRLLVLTFLLGMTVCAQGQADSLGIQRRGDEILVLHKVKSGQTLYSLSRRYGTSVKSIRDENGGLSTGLKVGETLKIPYGKEVKAAIPQSIASDAKIHTVGKGETLFSISRKYGLKVDELKTLNKLSSNALALGQKLIVEAGTPEPVQPTQPVETVPKEEPVANERQNLGTPESETPAEVADTTRLLSAADTASTTTEVEKEEPAAYEGTPFKEITEEGAAELIEEEEPSKKFLALHKTAKVGTVIKIRNLKNDLTVYVRVVGQIPDTSDNENVLIKINKRAHDQLKALDSRFMAVLSYFQ
ncbi:MAG: LysM peptidoglycan-binding domain-containing protein [Roseivirga sp.]|nr:LysM peptidoglycan-binding domain-containing protein [Roseivirga sp.]